MIEEKIPSLDYLKNIRERSREEIRESLLEKIVSQIEARNLLGFSNTRVATADYPYGVVAELIGAFRARGYSVAYGRSAGRIDNIGLSWPVQAEAEPTD